MENLKNKKFVPYIKTTNDPVVFPGLLPPGELTQNQHLARATFRFGKHRNSKISEVMKYDPDYIQWVLEQKSDEHVSENMRNAVEICVKLFQL